ncbi:MAG: class I SAM-dependent methyltransferase [Pseudomonadota bacterium]
MTDKRTIVREFDAKAPHYETNRLATWYKAHAREIVDRLELPPGSLVLDVGCGSGYLLREIVKRFPGVDGAGVDLAPAMIEEARARAVSEGMANLRFDCADWEDSSFDGSALLGNRTPSCLLCVNTLHYFSSPQAAFDKMWHTLAPGGQAWVLERAREGSFLTAVWGYLHHYLIRDHVRFYRTEELLEMMRRAGFQQARTELSLKKLFWQGKTYTSLALISGTRV